MDCCRIRVFSLRCDIISGDVKSLRWINFQINEVYSQVAYEMYMYLSQRPILMQLLRTLRNGSILKDQKHSVEYSDHN